MRQISDSKTHRFFFFFKNTTVFIFKKIKLNTNIKPNKFFKGESHNKLKRIQNMLFLIEPNISYISFFLFPFSNLFGLGERLPTELLKITTLVKGYEEDNNV